MVIHSGCEWLGIQWVKVTLYFYLREQIAKRLHHGLSEAILENTLTDVRELKKTSFIAIFVDLFFEGLIIKSNFRVYTILWCIYYMLYIYIIK